MAEFNFNPKLNPKVIKELERREGAVRTSQEDWMYKKYAYFYFESMSVDDDPNATTAIDYLPVFALIPNGGTTIGVTNQDGYIDTFFRSPNNIKSFKPLLKSATIKATGGSDLFDAYISQVDIQFKAFTVDQITEIEREFFQLGANVKIKFGWSYGGGNRNVNDGELIINVYNFGFSMSTDGSFDCTLSGLTEGVLMGNQSVSVVCRLLDTERDALGIDSATSATPPMALLAKCYSAFGVEGGELNPIGNGIMQSVSYRNKFRFYLTGINVGDNKTPDTQVFSYIGFEDLIKFIQDEIPGDSQFEFMSNKTEIKVPNIEINKRVLKKETFGSADPTRYIFPGKFAVYSRGAVEGHNFAQVINLGSTTELDIRHIAISIDVFREFYESSFSKVMNKQSPPKTVDIIKALSDDINKLSGGLVNIQVVPDVTDVGNSKIEANKFKIFNNNEVQKVKPEKSDYTFKVMGPGSIVKSVSLSSDFDVDTMLATTVGRVKQGDFNIKPLQSLSGGKIPDITNTFESRMVDLYATKTSILSNGVSKNTTANLIDGFRKTLTSDTSTDSTFVTLPYNLKLNVTIDGIHGLGFLQPIKVDRLPRQYQETNADVRFLIIGIEHSFDGQGGWETSIDTAMKVGN